MNVVLIATVMLIIFMTDVDGKDKLFWKDKLESNFLSPSWKIWKVKNNLSRSVCSRKEISCLVPKIQDIMSSVFVVGSEC